MNVSAQLRVAVALGGTFLALSACGGGAAGRRAAATAGPPPQVVKQMQVPESPYYLIYSPPVNLAKPPDTTAHGRKPRGSA